MKRQPTGAVPSPFSSAPCPGSLSREAPCSRQSRRAAQLARSVPGDRAASLPRPCQIASPSAVCPRKPKPHKQGTLIRSLPPPPPVTRDAATDPASPCSHGAGSEQAPCPRSASLRRGPHTVAVPVCRAVSPPPMTAADLASSPGPNVSTPQPSGAVGAGVSVGGFLDSALEFR